MAIAISFKQVQVIPLSKSPAKVLVRWQTNKEAADLSDYEFYIERSGGQNNIPGFQHVDIRQVPLPPAEHTDTKNFRTISRAIDGLDNQWFLDYGAELLNLSEALYYRVRCRQKSTQEEVTSATFDMDGSLDLVGLYVADEINFELEDVTGVPSLIYNRRRGGAYCSCFDRIQKKTTISNCQKCYGTNWVGGYYDPIDSWVDFNPNPKNSLITQWGEVQQNETVCMISNFPIVNPGDLIRELKPNRLWRVGQRVRVVEKRRVTLLQFPEITEVKPGDIEYKMPIDEQFLLAKIQELEATRKKREF